jgi:hypothetical protein
MVRPSQSPWFTAFAFANDVLLIGAFIDGSEVGLSQIPSEQLRNKVVKVSKEMGVHFEQRSKCVRRTGFEEELRFGDFRKKARLPGSPDTIASLNGTL